MSDYNPSDPFADESPEEKSTYDRDIWLLKGLNAGDREAIAELERRRGQGLPDFDGSPLSYEEIANGNNGRITLGDSSLTPSGNMRGGVALNGEQYLGPWEDVKPPVQESLRDVWGGVNRSINAGALGSEAIPSLSALIDALKNGQ